MVVSTTVLKTIQAASGLTMAVYVAMHLFNHYLLNISYERADATMTALRAIYRTKVFEVAFFLALIVHYYVNWILYTKRSKMESAKNKKNDDGGHNSTQPDGAPELKAHRIAGYALSLFIFGHTYATRVVPLLHFDDPDAFDYSFGAAPIPLIPYHLFSFYYVIFGVAGGWHLIYGTRSALATLQGKSVMGKLFPLPLKFAAMVNHLLILGAVLAMGRYAVEIDWPLGEKEMHSFFLKVVGV